MPIYNKLKYAWLRAPRLIPPLFKAGDKVRQRWGNSGRIPCYPDRRKVLPQVFWRGQPYTVRQIVFFKGGNKNTTGYRVEFAEIPDTWFWANDFINYDHSGWIAPASDLNRVDREFFKWINDYPWLWFSPCRYCCSPRPWYLSEQDPRHKCDICGRLAHNHTMTRNLELALVNLDHIIPGKKVRPIGPGVLPKMVPNESFVSSLDVNREYIIKGFHRGDESLVTLKGLRGVYSTIFLMPV